MFLFICRRQATGAVFTTMVLLLSAGLSDVMGSSRRRPGSSSSSRESPALGSVGSPGEERCPEGWLYSHRFCLLHTGLRDSEAEEVCAKKNALQAQGICIAKPITEDSPLDLLPLDKEDDDWAAFDASPLPYPSSSSSSTSLLSLGSSSVSSSLTPSSDYECPRGWKRFQNYCIIRPGAASQICTLLGAHYLFNYCVASLPHQLSMDFVKAANELEGSKSNFLRVARICCCKGSGYCK